MTSTLDTRDGVGYVFKSHWDEKDQQYYWRNNRYLLDLSEIYREKPYNVLVDEAQF